MTPVTPEEISALLYRRICQVTTKYTFTAPVETADLEHVRAELAAAVPECRVTVFNMPGEAWVSVNVYAPGKLGEVRTYHRLMLVKR